MRGQCKKCGHDGCCCDTPTPWTDANEEDGWNPCGWAVASDLVRELERELTAVTEQRDRFCDALQSLNQNSVICGDESCPVSKP
jgi:hypothetical protein